MYSSINQQHTSAIKVATMRSTENFIVMKKKPSHANNKSTSFIVSKGKWDTKELGNW